jgi:hypothetical protein
MGDSQMGLDAAAEILRKLYEKQVEEVLTVPELPAGSSTKLEQCKLIDLQFVKTFALTASCKYHSNATGALRIHVRTSPHGGFFDTTDFATTDLPVTAGKQERKTVLVSPEARYLKVMAENLDGTYPIYDVSVIATY